MKIKLKGICININKSRNINKLELLKELCLNELTNKDTYKGKTKLLIMIVSMLNKRISIQHDTEYAFEVDTVLN